MKVLIAEDDNINAHVLTKLLENLGHEPTLAKDGQEALTVMIADPHPVVISDWMMPGMDGISLCQSIRGLKLRWYVYFILLTAKIPQSRGCDVLAHGVDAFLPKPVNRETLRAKLNIAQSVMDNLGIQHVA